jgi:hypothetical protein
MKDICSKYLTRNLLPAPFLMLISDAQISVKGISDPGCCKKNQRTQEFENRMHTVSKETVAIFYVSWVDLFLITNIRKNAKLNSSKKYAKRVFEQCFIVVPSHGFLLLLLIHGGVQINGSGMHFSSGADMKNLPESAHKHNCMIPGYVFPLLVGKIDRSSSSLIDDAFTITCRKRYRISQGDGLQRRARQWLTWFDLEMILRSRSA